MKKIIFFGFLSEKDGKMSKKVKKDENGSDIDEKGQNWWKMKNIIFVGFFFRKTWKNVAKSEKWWKLVRYWWKRSKLMKNE